VGVGLKSTRDVLHGFAPFIDRGEDIQLHSSQEDFGLPVITKLENFGE
jgi:hypothetical protein